MTSGGRAGCETPRWFAQSPASRAVPRRSGRTVTARERREDSQAAAANSAQRTQCRLSPIRPDIHAPDDVIRPALLTIISSRLVERLVSRFHAAHPGNLALIRRFDSAHLQRCVAVRDTMPRRDTLPPTAPFIVSCRTTRTESPRGRRSDFSRRRRNFTAHHDTVRQVPSAWHAADWSNVRESVLA